MPHARAGFWGVCSGHCRGCWGALPSNALLSLERVSGQQCRGVWQRIESAASRRQVDEVGI